MINTNTSISFELFPPKTPEGFDKLLGTIKQLVELKPNFFSVTYGAGGGSRDKTLDIVAHIQDTYKIPAIAHLTCVMHTKDEIRSILEEMNKRGIHQVLALRGDPPKDNPDWTPGPENFKYSSELVQFIREEFGDYFAIGVAGFPEGHLLSTSRDQDADIMRLKVEAGADFIITQLFFNTQDYADYVGRLRERNIQLPVIPGILTITDYAALVRFCNGCGATIPQSVHDIFKPLSDDPIKTLEAGIEFAKNQCQELLAHGAPGLHFYTLNKISPTNELLHRLRQ